MNTIPFDLEKYNSDKYPVVYRNGEKCVALYHIKEANQRGDAVLMTVNQSGNTHHHFLDGLTSSISVSYDLLLIVPDEIKKVFFNEYADNKEFKPAIHNSLDSAINLSSLGLLGTWECSLNLTTGEGTMKLIRKQ